MLNSGFLLAIWAGEELNFFYAYTSKEGLSLAYRRVQQTPALRFVIKINSEVLLL
jgi:hypothetical protein